VGGNRKAREFFESQPDWDNTMSLQQRYNTKAAALYRDKVRLKIFIFAVFLVILFMHLEIYMFYLF
jgi:hypothetical protein